MRDKQRAEYLASLIAGYLSAQSDKPVIKIKTYTDGEINVSVNMSDVMLSAAQAREIVEAAKAKYGLGVTTKEGQQCH